MKPRIKQLDDNRVEVTLKNGKRFYVTSDNGTALQLARSLTDWQSHFARLDEAEEVTQVTFALGGNSEAA